MNRLRLTTSIRGAAFGLALSVLPLAAVAAPQTFPTPQAAVDAVIAALEAKSREQLLAVFGPESEDVIFTGEDPTDRANWSKFLRDYRSMHDITTDAAGTTATLSIGPDLWPFPAPLVEEAGAWHFDVDSARDEVLARRIGQNELDVIDLLHGYVRAQARYRAADPSGDGLHSFADAIISAAGKRDGLYWPSEPNAPVSPIGDFMARAAADGYSFQGTDQDPDPYLGYYYRILTKQGPGAPGGAMDYMINGHMVAGHALIAFPSDYGNTGIMTFIVGENDVVYEKDLGEDTLELANAIDSFDPGDGWVPAESGAAQ